jgi:protein-S-isoprenylcysteine O-methyltransferase Ste14
MTEESQSSKQFGLAQSMILCIFAAAYFADRGPWLFTSAVASAAGLAFSAIGLAIMLAAIIALRAVIQVAPEPKAGGHLVTRGIYARDCATPSTRRS